MSSYGIVYSAVGRLYNQEAIASAKSVHKYHKINITIFTDDPSFIRRHNTNNLFHKIHKIDTSPIKKLGYKVAPYAKIQKIKAMASFPYDITLYLDCDTKIKGSISDLFKKYIIDKDMCIAHSPYLDKTQRPFRLVKYERPKAYNSGVIVYQKNENMTNLFRRWLKKVERDPNIYQKGKGKFYDQPKLVSLLNESGSNIKMRVIPNVIYNVRHTMVNKMKRDNIMKKAKIVHHH